MFANLPLQAIVNGKVGKDSHKAAYDNQVIMEAVMCIQYRLTEEQAKVKRVFGGGQGRDDRCLQPRPRPRLSNTVQCEVIDVGLRLKKNSDSPRTTGRQLGERSGDGGGGGGGDCQCMEEASIKGKVCQCNAMQFKASEANEKDRLNDVRLVSMQVGEE